MLRQEFYVMIILCLSNLHDVKNSITEIPEVGPQLPERRATLHSWYDSYELVSEKKKKCRANGSPGYILTSPWVNPKGF